MKARRYLVLFCLMICISTSTVVEAQELEGKLYCWGKARDVVVVDNYAYVIDGAGGIWAVDVADPENPSADNYVDTPSYSLSLDVTGNYIAIADWNGGTRIFDISVPDEFYETGAYENSYGYYHEVKNYESKAITLGWFHWYYGISSVDFSQPEDPDIGGIIPTETRCERADISGNLMCITGGEDGFLLYDPENMMFLGEGDTDGFATAVSISGNYIYIADHESGINIIDASVYEAPDNIGFYPCNVNDLIVSDNMAYCVTGDLEIVDVSSPESPVIEANCPTPGFANGIQISNGFAYVADSYNGLCVVNLSGDTPSVAGSYDPAGYANDIRFDDDYSFIIGEGFSTINCSDRDYPVFEGSLPLTGKSIDITENYAFVTVDTVGLVSVDISDPPEPVEVGSVATEEIPLDVDVIYNTAYVVATDTSAQLSTFYIINVLNPATMSITGSLSFGHDIYNVDVQGDYAYVAAGSEGILVIDISNPEQPDHILNIPAGGAKNITVRGDFAYICRGGPGIRITDISDLENPETVFSDNTPGNAISISVVDTYAYVSDGTAGLIIYDIANPDSIREISTYDHEINSVISNIAIGGDIAYVASGCEFMILNCENIVGVEETKTTILPQDFRIESVYPNPFNPSTNITVALPYPSKLSVSVFNTLGQKVAELANGHFEGGYQEFTLDGSNLSSGVYFVQASLDPVSGADAVTNSIVGKVVLMK